jgi:hypothetical protein
MVTESLERNRLPAQRKVRRLRQLRLLHGSIPQSDGNGTSPANGATLKPPRGHSLEELGWTIEQALATYYKLKSFEEDWNAPGMEDYDTM